MRLPLRHLHALALAALLTSTVAGQVTRHYKVVALQGDPAPSAGPTATYGIFGFDPRIGQDGHVVFGGFVGNNGADNFAVWTGRPGAIEALAVQNDPAPGRAGETLDVFYQGSEPPYWVCPDGSAAFEARVKPSNDDGIWLGKPGELLDVAIINNPVPGVAGATFKSPFDGAPAGLGFLANGDGEVMLKGTMQGGGVSAINDTAVWTGLPGALTILAREGEQAPGLPGGVNFGDVNFTTLSAQMSLNAQSEFCLSAPIQTGSIANDRALFVGSRANFTKFLQKGGPTGHAGDTWATFDKPRLNNDRTVFIENAPLGQPRSFYTHDRNGVTRLLAREDEEPPGAAGATWDQFFFAKPALGGNDYLAFNAGLDPGANFDKDAMWLAQGGTPALIAREGDPAPGLPGQTFAEFQRITFHRAPAVNAEGTVVFRAWTNTGGDGLWRWNNGNFELLLAVGDFLDLGGGDVRRVADYSVQLGSGGQSGRPSALNDCGQLVFRAAFDSGALGTAVMLIESVLDCDGDGVESLLEEAFGGDPADPTDGVALLPRVERAGTDLKLIFLRRTDGSFTYDVERSSDLENWAPSGLVPELAADQNGVPNGTERVEVTLPLNGGGSDHLQVRVTRVTP